MGRTGWASASSPGVTTVLVQNVRQWLSPKPRTPTQSSLLPGASPRPHSSSSGGLPGGRASPGGLHIGRASPGRLQHSYPDDPERNHGHGGAVRRGPWRFDRFTVLCICFLLLLGYTILRQTATPTVIAPSSTGHVGAHAHSHHGHDHGGPSAAAHHELEFARAPSAQHLAAYTPSDSTESNAVEADGGMDSGRTAFQLERIPLLEASEGFPLDSTGETLMLRPRHEKDFSHSYHVCSFTNVCVGTDGLRFRFQNHTRWLEYRDLAKRCASMEYYWNTKICHCFHYAFKPDVLPYEFVGEITEPIEKMRQKEAAMSAQRNLEGLADASLDSLARRYPDPFAHVDEAKHGHYWSIHKWVPHHHIAHWAQKLLIWQSIFQHHSLLDTVLPPLDGMVFHDTSNTRPPLEDHLLNIFRLATESAVGFTSEREGAELDEWAHPNMWNGDDAKVQMQRLMDPDSGRLIWAEDIEKQTFTTSQPPGACVNNPRCKVQNPAYQAGLIALEAARRKAGGEDPSLPSVPVDAKGRPLPEHLADPALQTCFARVSLSPIYGLLSLDPADAHRFREVTAERMSLPAELTRSCPPRRAILLTRPDRRILNVQDLDDFMLKRFNLQLEHHELSGRNTSIEQVRLFATSGLVLSSHSSQLINVLFSHAAQALVEITAEFYNVDFASYAHALGLNFHYALGGSIPRSTADHPGQSKDFTYVHDPLMVDCVAALQAACPTGDSWCITEKSFALCNSITQWPNKKMNFFANLTAIELAVQSAIGHIQDRCFGKW